MTGGAAVLMAEQSFSVFLSHSCCTQPYAKGVLQIVNADSGKAIICRPQILLLLFLRRPHPGLLPG